jgi:hypothetical protein
MGLALRAFGHQVECTVSLRDWTHLSHFVGVPSILLQPRIVKPGVVVLWVGCHLQQ